jgi:hypothetical protein
VLSRLVEHPPLRLGSVGRAENTSYQGPNWCGTPGDGMLLMPCCASSLSHGVVLSGPGFLMSSGRTPWGHAPAVYNPNYNDGLQPQNHSTYQNPGWQRTGNGNTGYYGGGYQSSQPTGNSGDWQQPPGYTQGSYEMQPPQRVYGNDARQGGAGDGFVYQVPAGPPPRKN